MKLSFPLRAPKANAARPRLQTEAEAYNAKKDEAAE
jgi:hypothetical protein